MPRVEALAERVARDVVVEGRELPERLERVDERRERVDEVRAHGERHGETDGERLPPRSRREHERDRAVGDREHDEDGHRGAEVGGRDVHPEDPGTDPQREPEHHAEADDLRAHGGELLDGDPRPRAREGEQQVEGATLFFAGDRPGSVADRSNEEQRGDHEGEELAPEIPRSRREVGLAAERDERLERLRVALDELVQIRVVPDRRIDRDDQRDVAREAERPADEAPAEVAERLREDATEHPSASGTARGTHPPGRPRGCRAPRPRTVRAPSRAGPRSLRA